MVRIENNVAYTQAFGCRFCLHIGSLAIFFGNKTGGRGPRVEIMTPCRWFRWSSGYMDKRKVAA